MPSKGRSRGDRRESGHKANSRNVNVNDGRRDVVAEKPPIVKDKDLDLSDVATNASAKQDESLGALGSLSNVPGLKELIASLTAKNAEFDQSQLMAVVQQCITSKTEKMDLSGTDPYNGESSSTPAVVTARAPDYSVSVKKTDQLASRLATMMTDPMTIRSQQEAAARAESSLPDYMRIGSAGRELQVEMNRGITAEEFRATQQSVLDSVREDPHNVIEFHRKTKAIKSNDVGDSMLKIIMSDSGMSGIITEMVPNITLRRDINLDTQIAILAIKIMTDFHLDQPFVLALQKNALNDAFNSEMIFSTDGLSTAELIRCLDSHQRCNNQPGLALDVSGRNNIRNLSQILDGVDGRTITQCLDGYLKNAFISYAAAEWAKNIIPIKRYQEILRQQIPAHYSLKTYSPLVERKGFVYYRENQGSLALFLKVTSNAAFEYFIPAYLRQFSITRVKLVSVSSFQSALAIDSGARGGQASMANSLISSIQTTGNDKVMSYILAGCVFPGFKFSIDFSTTPTIVDCAAAALYLLFVGKQSITDSSLSSTLMCLASFISQQALFTLVGRSNSELRNMLRASNWPFVDTYDSTEYTLQYSALMSQGQPGYFRGAFNMSQEHGIRHANPSICSDISSMANNRWRSGISNNIGSLMTSILSRVFSTVNTSLLSYDSVIHRIRGGIPNSVIEHMNDPRGVYRLTPVEFVSYFATLSEISEGPELYEHIDVSAMQMLGRFNDLAFDLTRTLQLTRTVMRVHQARSVGTYSLSTMLNTVVDSAWSRGDSGNFMTETLKALYSMALIDGKDGLKLLMNELIRTPITETYDEPLVRITDEFVRLIKVNLSSFGVAERILICPNTTPVSTDVRFANVFKRSPFVAVMPDGFPTHSYSDFRTNPNASALFRSGLILVDGPFNFSISYKTSGGNSYMASDVVTITADGVTVNAIDYVLCMNDGASAIDDASFMMDRTYMVYIITPNNITPLLEYNSLVRRYENADRDAVYPDDHTFAYARN